MIEQPRLNDAQRYFVEEFVMEYKAGHMSRRDMVARVMYITGGVASTATLLLAMGCQPTTPAATATAVSTSAPAPTAAPKPATAPPAPAAASTAAPAVSPSTAVAAASPAAKPAASPAAAPPTPTGARSPLSVAANDPAIQAEIITFQGNGATIMAYQARPRNQSGPLPVLLVCHENRGLTEHIQDVTRRFAKEGYLAAALDLLSREGGTAKVEDARIPAVLSGVDQNRHVGDFKAALAYYQTQGSIARPDRIAMTGYCFGGGITWRTATQAPDLKAASPYYGAPPPLSDVPGIKAAVFGVYSSDPQDFANNGRDALEAALKAANVTYQVKVYPNTRHAFHNDTGAAWNPEQGPIAFRDTLDWFAKYVK